MSTAKKIDFFSQRKKYIIIMLVIFALSILVNIFAGVKMNIAFTGGTVMKYSYTGEVNESEINALVNEVTGEDITVSFNTSLLSGAEGEITKNISLSFSQNTNISPEVISKLTTELETKYPDNNFVNIESRTQNATMGLAFFGKCIAAIVLAFILVVIYIGIRFRKIGGLTAGIMSVLALLVDVLVAYFTFVVCRYSIDTNFVAVVLTLIGYSINNTIVVFDRVRDNRKVLGPKVALQEVVNKSINETLKRSVITTSTTLMSIICVAVIALLFNVESILTFAIPMLFGLISGFFSSIFLAPLNWVVWQNKINERKKAKRAK